MLSIKMLFQWARLGSLMIQFGLHTVRVLTEMDEMYSNNRYINAGVDYTTVRGLMV
jgi:hypothetical protein